MRRRWKQTALLHCTARGGGGDIARAGDCNAAWDLVLDDPEDGAVEQVNAQLPGGVNRGHTTGPCHTAGMRDPAHSLDASRNATINANAAR